MANKSSFVCLARECDLVRMDAGVPAGADGNRAALRKSFLDNEMGNSVRPGAPRVAVGAATSSELAKLVEIWPRLSGEVQAQIMRLVDRAMVTMRVQ